MSHQHKITCDGCQANITESSCGRDEYGLHLTNFVRPHNGPTQTLAMVYPEIKGEMHFCGIACIRKWLALLYSVKGTHTCVSKSFNKEPNESNDD